MHAAGAGDDIAIRALHSDRVMYRWRRALVEEVRADRVVTYAGVGGAILSPAYGRVIARDHVRSIRCLSFTTPVGGQHRRST